MIDWPAVLTVFCVYAAGVVIPGPNFVAVVHKAVSSPRFEALALISGIVAVNLFWATCAIFGIGMVFASLPWLASSIRIAGAIYLMWFGLRLVRSKTSSGPTRNPRWHPMTSQSAFLQGVATNITNPKSIAFYAAVFSAATPEHVAAPTFIAMLSVVLLTATAWYGAVALILSQAPISAAYGRAKSSIDVVSGILIISLGIRHAFL
ncbi:LysE family translocator [Burkholderia cepacia]|uniref:LysE family translocator n=1 Tax=Burkholderia cepacia TaxID=292 RepID=UPI002AB76024|nr:LysE family translocator [Burkholderia cepacia]